ncbi:MAG: SLC13 family permease [Bacillota bacterium]
MDLKIKDIVAMWPTNLFFLIMAITFFYGFAIASGTLEKIARKTVYATRNFPFFVPIALYLLAVTMSGIGPGPYAVFAFLSPLVMAIASETGMSRLLGAVIIVGGGVAGGFTKLSIGGGIAKGLIEKAGFVEQAEIYTSSVFWNSFLAETIIFFIAYFILKGYKIKPVTMERPANFTREQRINVILILSALAAIVIPSTLASLIPGVPILELLKKQLDVTFISIIAAILAIFFKIGSEKEALSKVPWGTIILLCGVGVLIEIAVKAGTIKALAAWMGSNVSPGTAPIALTLVAATMSFFSSTMGVVMPTLYPIVPGIAKSVGANLAVLFSIITVAAAFTGFSPFSSGGALTLTGVVDEAEKKKLFTQLLVLPFLAGILAILLVATGIIR